MSLILRYDGAVECDPAIETWLNSRPEELGVIARRWFKAMRGSGKDVRELMHDGCPVVCVEDGPFAYVNAFTSHVNVGFFQGAALQMQHRAGFLEGNGKRMRHVKLRRGVEIDAAALEALIHAAYLDIKVRLAAERG